MPLSITIAGILAPGPLSYHTYAADCEATDEPWLELVVELAAVFDHAYLPQLLCRALGELNPVVQLLVVDEPDDTRRQDWPWLSDEDLDALEARCCRLLGDPARGSGFARLLGTLRPILQPTLQVVFVLGCVLGGAATDFFAAADWYAAMSLAT